MGLVTSCMKSPKKLNSKVEITQSDYTTSEINIIQRQWSVAMRKCDTVGYKLFEKLFQHKEVMAKFDFAVAVNLDVEKALSDARLSFHIRRVFHTINTVVTGLHDSEFIRTTLEHVGAIHAEYGLQLNHLLRFKEAMLETLAEAFKEAFTEEARSAWTKVIDTLANHMLQGIKKAEQQPIIEEKEETT